MWRCLVECRVRQSWIVRPGHTSSSNSGSGGLTSSEGSTAAHYSLELLSLVSKSEVLLKEKEDLG